jgi:hypothetical protein
LIHRVGSFREFELFSEMGNTAVKEMKEVKKSNNKPVKKN